MWVNPGEIDGVAGHDDDGNGIVDDIYGADFSSPGNPSGDPMDDHGHGTHTAGTVAAPRDGTGIDGVAGVSGERTKLMAIKILNAYGHGSLTNILRGLNYAVSKSATGSGAKISNNSWGTCNGQETSMVILKDVLENIPNHLFVSAAGNYRMRISDNLNGSFPCNVNALNQICVGSTTINGSKALHSNYGKPHVHTLAPGTHILSTYPNNDYRMASGTSMATPHVSGLAALVMTFASFPATRVKQLIEENVQQKEELIDMASSGGLIDVGATVEAATIAVDTGKHTWY